VAAIGPQVYCGGRDTRHVNVALLGVAGWRMKTAFLIGSGAIDGAWQPVCAAIRDVYGERVPNTSAAANTIFASLVYELRWSFQVRRTTPRTQLPQLDRQRARLLAKYARVKRRIAFRLRNAERSGELSVRPPLRDLITQHVGPTPCVFTTNWDRTLERFLGENYRTYPPVVHLHGSSKDSKSLYLPSEVIEEPYRARKENRAFGGRAVQMIQVIERCERLVVYGLSFDPLDAELGVVVASAAADIKEIVVVDPMPEIVIEGRTIEPMDQKRPG
jgi:hypothetical protein